MLGLVTMVVTVGCRGSRNDVEDHTKYGDG